MRVIGVAAAFIAAAFFVVAPAFAEPRLALVIANSAYQGAQPIATAAADAGLIAAALQKAGFDVTRSDDLTTQNMGAALGAFTGKVQAAGPDAIVFVYFSGYAVQVNGDDHLVPVDAQITTAASVADVTLPLSALTKALGDIPSSARIIVLDAARDGNFGKVGGQPVAPGLALTTVPSGFVLAYSAAPDSYAPLAHGSSSPYASALATLLAQPGLDIEQVFKGVRLQVNLATTGAQVPWTSSALDSDVELVAAPAAGPAGTAVAAAPAQTLAPALGVSNLAVPPRKRGHITKSSMRGMSGDEAYDTAIEDDSLRDYQWFVETHPDYTRAGQIWNMIGSRREGLLWRRTTALGSTRAYWNYLDRYPDGAHADIARSVLAERGQPLPSDYVAQPLDLPPGYSDEAMGLPDLMPDGFDRPADVFFGSPDPEFIPAPTDGSVNFNFNFGKRKKRDQNQAGINSNPLPPNQSPLPLVGPCGGCPGPDGKPTGLPPSPVVNNKGTPVAPDHSVVNGIPVTPDKSVVDGTPVTPINSASKPITGDADQQKMMRDLQQRLKQREQQQTSSACDEFGKAGNNATDAQRLRCFNDLTKTTSAPANDLNKSTSAPAQTPINAVPTHPRQATGTNCVNGATNKQLSGCLDELGKVHDKRADDLQKTILKQLDDQTKKKAAEDAAKAKEDATKQHPVASSEPAPRLTSDPSQPNRWQKLLQEKKAAAQAGTQKSAGSENSTAPSEKPFMEFSTQPSGATPATQTQSGASISSGVSADQGGDLDEAVARPVNKRNGLTIPSHTAAQPQIVMPPATAEQKRLGEQVQERLKAQGAATQNRQGTKSGGLTIPSHTASQPQIVMSPPTAEQRRLSEEVQQRLKAQSEAAQKQHGTKSGGLAIPSHTASQPKIVMPPPTLEQRRLSEQVQERLKARSEAVEKRQATKSGGLAIPSSQQPMQAQKLQREQPQQQQAQQKQQQERLREQEIQQQQAQQKQQQDRLRDQQLQQQQAQQKQLQEQLRDRQLQQQQAQQKQQQEQLRDRQLQQQQAQQKEQQDRSRQQQLQQRQVQEKQQQERVRQQQLQQQQAQQKQQQERLHQQQTQQRAQQERAQQERMRAQQQAQQRAQQMRAQQEAQQRAQQQRLRSQQQGRARQMQERAMQQRQMQQRQAQQQMQQRQMQERMMQQRVMQQRHAQAPSCPQGSRFMNGRCVR